MNLKKRIISIVLVLLIVGGFMPGSTGRGKRSRSITSARALP